MFDLRVPQQNGSPSSCNGHRLNHEVPLPVKGLIHILQRLQWIHHDRHGIWHFATTPMTLPPMGPMGPMGPVAERHAESTSPKLLAQARRIISVLPAPSLIRLRLINLQWSCRIRSNAVLSSLSSTEQCCSAKPD